MSTLPRSSGAATLMFLVLGAGVVAAQAPPAQGQAQRGGQGQAVADVDPNARTLARVRVPTTHANIHAGPSTSNEVIVLAPKGTELAMVARRGEWIQVRIPPELRKTGIVMRWYKNENGGWMHDSTVEFLTPETR